LGANSLFIEPVVLLVAVLLKLLVDDFIDAGALIGVDALAATGVLIGVTARPILDNDDDEDDGIIGLFTDCAAAA